MNISSFKNYLSIWADSAEEMRSLAPRLLNGAPARVQKYEKGNTTKYRCGFKAGLIRINGKDYYVKATAGTWVLMPSKPKNTVAKATVTQVNMADEFPL